MAAMALTTQLIGVNTVLGAFVAGILIGESPMLTRHIDEELRGLIVALFMPVFFGLSGLNADLTILRSPGLALLAVGLIVIASIGKFLGAFIGGTIGGLSRAESLALGCGMNARGSTEVIVATLGLSMVPAAARPNATAMITQPIVSSRIAEATMICPRSRRMKFISRMTIATIFTEEMDSAVPRKIAVTTRASGLGRNSAGKNSTSVKPQANGMATPAIAARPTRRTICKSVSMPVSSNSISTPSSDTASSMLFCTGSAGKIAC